MRYMALLLAAAATPVTHATIHLDNYTRGTPAGRVVLTQRGPTVAIRVELLHALAGARYRLYRRHTAHTVLSCETFYDHVGTSFDPADPTPADAELPLDRDLRGPDAVLKSTTIAQLRIRDGVIAVWTPHEVVCGDL